MVCGKSTEKAEPRAHAPMEAPEGLAAHHRHRCPHRRRALPRHHGRVSRTSPATPSWTGGAG
ncbi:MAG: hypothetical protein MZV70_19165 [Desulfobacterales bacterium]|nr:hypothetical protein [Desulfobacterales bacterium]